MGLSIGLGTDRKQSGSRAAFTSLRVYTLPGVNPPEGGSGQEQPYFSQITGQISGTSSGSR